MTSIFGKIQELEQLSRLSKHEQLVQGVINAINDKILVQGNMLPSVNSMVKELGFSSKTIVKAYKELIERGLVESKNRLGYFVINDATDQTMKVALLLYAFHPIQETFYNAFRSALGDNIQLDVFFHHSNVDIFEAILNKIKGQYGMYVIAPIPDEKTRLLLEGIPVNKLLIVDRFEPLNDGMSHVTQEFEISTYMALKSLLEPIRQYEEVVLFFRPDTDHPKEIERAFQQFLKDFEVKGKVMQHYVPGTVKKGTVYFTIGDGDLWGILKDCKEQSLEVGKDVGVFSNSNDPVKEIICDGITTNSTDFSLMGQRAAEYILNREPMQITIPTILIRRNSL